MCASNDSDIDELFQALGWGKLKHQRFESAAVMMYKSLHGMTPEYLSSRFVFRNDKTSYRSRKIGSSAAPHQLFEEEFLLQRRQVMEQPI